MFRALLGDTSLTLSPPFGAIICTRYAGLPHDLCHIVSIVPSWALEQMGVGLGRLEFVCEGIMSHELILGKVWSFVSLLEHLSFKQIKSIIHVCGKMKTRCILHHTVECFTFHFFTPCCDVPAQIAKTIQWNAISQPAICPPATLKGSTGNDGYYTSQGFTNNVYRRRACVYCI